MCSKKFQPKKFKKKFNPKSSTKKFKTKVQPKKFHKKVPKILKSSKVWGKIQNKSSFVSFYFSKVSKKKIQ